MSTSLSSSEPSSLPFIIMSSEETLRSAFRDFVPIDEYIEKAPSELVKLFFGASVREKSTGSDKMETMEGKAVISNDFNLSIFRFYYHLSWHPAFVTAFCASFFYSETTF